MRGVDGTASGLDPVGGVACRYVAGEAGGCEGKEGRDGALPPLADGVNTCVKEREECSAVHKRWRYVNVQERLAPVHGHTGPSNSRIPPRRRRAESGRGAGAARQDPVHSSRLPAPRPLQHRDRRALTRWLPLSPVLTRRGPV